MPVHIVYVCGTKQQQKQQPQCQCMWHNFKYAAPEILLHWLHASTSRARTRCDATDSADSRLELLRCLAELDDSLICWQLAYNWRLMDGVLHCQDILRAASARFLYFLRSLSSALFAHFAACLQFYFNYFRYQCRIDKVLTKKINSKFRITSKGLIVFILK